MVTQENANTNLIIKMYNLFELIRNAKDALKYEYSIFV